MRLSFVPAVLVAALVACSTPGILTPKTGPGTSYPCGVNGVVCANGGCCSEGQTCGGAFPAVGCPAGSCCFIGDGDVMGSKRPQTMPATFATQGARENACLDLRDHAVEIYALEYLDENDLAMAAPERAAFIALWAEQLARTGAADRFQAACFRSLAPAQFTCGMGAKTSDGLSACMRFEAHR